MKAFLAAVFLILVVGGFIYVLVDPTTMIFRPYSNWNVFVAMLIAICGIVGMGQLTE